LEQPTQTTLLQREILNLMTAKLEEAKAYHLHELNMRIFDLATHGRGRPLTRRERFGLKVARVRGYFRTVWAAVCGQPLVLESED
jgi:hypothetical protein